MKTFSALGVSKNLAKGLKEVGIVEPTEIQEKVLSVLMSKRTDFIGLAQTGTGKTAAFGLPILQKIDFSKNEIQALILAPTRELVQQIKKQLFKFTKYVPEKIFMEEVYGGVKIEQQITRLQRTTHIVVATPGRLIELVDKKALNLKNIQTLVLDEADEMLSMGFKKDLNRILSYTNGTRNTWLFSATMPPEIKRIIKTYMDPNASKIEVNKNQLVNKNITHKYITTSIKAKTHVISELLRGRKDERGIIFCRSKAGVQNLCKQLKDKGFAVDALEGDMGQRDRDRVMRSFKNEKLQVLISTDVSARGIDVKDLAYVVHHQLPEQLEYYTHRSGRTARAGKKGVSIALVLPNELDKVKEVEKSLGITFAPTEY